SKAQRAEGDTIPYGVFRRAALDAVGPFDEWLPVAEDEDMTWRLRQAGYKIVLDGSLTQVYVTRPSFRAAFEQYRVYGRNRVRVVRKHPDYLRAYHVVPAAAVAGGALLAAAAPFSRPARVLLGLGAVGYAGVVDAAALSASSREAPRVAAALVALHAGYGVGMLAELAGREQ